MPLWTTLPPAAALLRSCAAREPKRRVFPYRFGDTSERYIGGRVKDLRAIYAAAEPEPYGSDNPAWVRWALLSPETAIREAVEAGETYGRKAA